MRKANAGFTLLEIMIAVSLLALLTVGVLISMRTSLNAMVKTNERLAENRRILGAQRILDSQLQGLVPAMALCGPGGDQPRAKLPFFQGEAQSMRFVSTYSLEEAWHGYSRILEYQVIPRETGKGFRLVVNELLYTGALSTGSLCTGRVPDAALGLDVTRFLPIRVGPQSFVLADNLAYCRFSYEELLPQPPFARWTTVWSPVRWPNAIRVEMAPLEAERAKPQPLTVTAPLHVDRLPGIDYVD